MKWIVIRYRDGYRLGVINRDRDYCSIHNDGTFEYVSRIITMGIYDRYL